jgi:hypothetical protein
MTMATVHSTSKPLSGRNRRSKPRIEAHPGIPVKPYSDKDQGTEQRAAIHICGRLREFLESEREFLTKTRSLLDCIAQSMDYGGNPAEGPYYPDVVSLASDLVRRRAINLDELLLDGRLPVVAGTERRSVL